MSGKDPESARNAEQIDIKRLPTKIQKVLNKYDVDGDGTITAAEFVIAMEQHEATKDSLKRQNGQRLENSREQTVADDVDVQRAHPEC